MRPPVTIRVTEADFDVAAEIDALAAAGGDVGAVVSFTGLCRSDGGRLSGLELQHYPGMADAEIGRVVEAARARWPAVSAVTVVHRHGLVRPGGRIVLVAVAAGHRGEAFAAAEYVMDFLKTRAPFWKREHLADGTIGGWVDARDADDAATERWSG
jgi:molybdopterin synthase catalytic subunit